jgi:hypothetical protein
MGSGPAVRSPHQHSVSELPQRRDRCGPGGHACCFAERTTEGSPIVISTYVGIRPRKGQIRKVSIDFYLEPDNDHRRQAAATTEWLRTNVYSGGIGHEREPECLGDRGIEDRGIAASGTVGGIPYCLIGNLRSTSRGSITLFRCPHPRGRLVKSGQHRSRNAFGRQGGRDHFPRAVAAD